MGRTRLRAMEIAGIRIAVEVPAGAAWQWPERTHAPFASSSDEPDLYVGVRFDLPQTASWKVEEPIRYYSRGRSFEVGRCAASGLDWIVRVEGPHGIERIARFDADLTEGEVALHPTALAEGVAPLDAPLDELVFLQAAARRGIVVVDGALRRSERGAFLELPSAEEGGLAPQLAEGGAVGSAIGLGRIALRPTQRGVRAYGTPWGTSGVSPEGHKLDAIHTLRVSHGAGTRALRSDDGFQALLGQLIAPVHDPAMGERLMESAAELSSRLTVIERSCPPSREAHSFDWGSSAVSKAFAAPRMA